MHVVIVGAGTSGIYALRWLTSLRRDIGITVLEKRTYPSYSPCGMPYALEGMTDIDSLIHPLPRGRNVDIILGAEVIEIGENYVAYRKSGSEKKLDFDKLIYAAGGIPIVPKLPGSELSGVFTLKTIEDIRKIDSVAKEGVKFAVIGGGAIGLEMAYALKKRGCDVKVFEPLPNVLPSVGDNEISKIVKEYLEKEGIEVHLNEGLSEILGEDKVRGIRTPKGDYECDYVLLSVGVRPNTSLLKGLVEMDEKGFILVDEFFRTSNENIYATGDCVLAPTVWGEKIPAQLASVAAKHGMIAAMHIAGVNFSYRGSTVPFVTKIGKIEIARVGRKTQKMVRVKAHSFAEYLGGKELIIKMFLTDELKIAGAIAIGEKAASMMDIVSMAMYTDASVEDLLATEFSYCPVVADLNHPVSLCAELAYRRFKR